jgi:hypothetical protein
MTEKAFRLDFFIAIAALVVSVLSTLTLIYQTRVIGQQYASTIWPYLSVVGTYDLHGISLDLVNNGMGPALIESAQLEVDGKPVAGWNGYFKALSDQPSIRKFNRWAEKYVLEGRLPPGTNLSFSTVGPETTIRPGDSAKLMTMEFPASVPQRAILAHRMTFTFCYCSLNANCWTLREDQKANARARPVSVATCATSYTIEPPTVTGAR